MFKSKLTRLVLALAMLSGSAGLNLALAGTATAAPECGVLAEGAAQEAQNAVDRACDQIGTPYSWGGGHGGQPGPSRGICDPANGAPNDCNVTGLDCSGLMRYAYYLAVDEDIINGTTYTQWQSSRIVDKFSAAEGFAPLLPGDLIFFSNLQHVAMYLGDGWMVEAPNSGAHVRVSSAISRGGYYGAIRLFEGGTSGAPPVGADRVAYTETDGALYARDGELGAGGELQEENVKKFEMSGDRVGVLTNDGALLVKEGDLGPGWHTVNPDSVTDFDLEGDRIAFTEGEDLYITEDLGGELVHQDAAVKKFQLDGDRVGVQTTDDKLLVKEGDLGPGWVEIATGVSSFQLHGNRIAYTEGNDLWAQEGELDEPSIFQEHDIRSYQLSGDRLGALTRTGMNLLVKEGDLEPGWVTVDTRVQNFQLEGTRIGYLKVVGEGMYHLWAQEGDLDAPSEKLLDDYVSNYQLDGDRIAVSTGGALQVKEGDLDAEWVTINPDSVTNFQIGADRSAMTSIPWKPPVK